ncbi:hypothetical protein AVEN_52647-1 [Araneus ventricosus]|uniref:DUF4371 domain-containing protein n=1 Tax=Araneus ventricosus TaxID=182803 RepID=A0A4Y2HD62_ARAVE|nr:hypothetical protein AVEN_52647-1 [Araneus ventricosus]
MFGHLIQSRIVRNARKSIFYSVFADETTDICQIEQFSLCVRYVEDQSYKIREDFLTFVPVSDVTGAGLANTVLETLSILGLDLKKMRGQGYDGASTMRGQFREERFESHKETVASLQHILPEFCTKTDFYSLEAAFNFYEEHLLHKEVMQSEFMLWKEKWSQEKDENLPKTASSSLEKCDKTFFPNIYILLKLLAVLSVSVATVERSFLRNTTSESRLNGLALLSIHLSH